MTCRKIRKHRRPKPGPHECRLKVRAACYQHAHLNETAPEGLRRKTSRCPGPVVGDPAMAHIAEREAIRMRARRVAPRPATAAALRRICAPATRRRRRG